MRKLFVPLLAVGMVVFADVSYAAFGGSRGSSGVSRSYSRPSTPTYSKPATTYKAPSYSTSKSTPSYSTSRSNNSGYSSSYKSNYGGGNSNSYSQGNYRDTSRSDYSYNNGNRSSTMRDIGVTAAGVGGGILAAQAITALVSSPGHAGMYTHPQYPGQYFNAQGVPMPAPVQQAPAAAPQQYEAPPVQQYIQPRSQQPQAPVVIYQAPQPQEQGFSFFGALWGALWFVIKLAFFLGVVGALGYGVYKLFTLGRRKEVRDQVEARIKDKFDLSPKGPSDFEILDSEAMDIFYDFQKNSDNEAWVRANTKYLPVEDCLSAPSKVIEFQHRTLDCTNQSGKTRGSVQYNAVLNDGTGKLKIEQIWNFEKDGDTWKLIGIEQDD